MPFICSGSPEYGWLKKLKALTPMQYTAFRARCRSLTSGEGSGLTVEKQLPLTQDKLPESIWLSDLLMDDDEVGAWGDAGVELTIKRMRGISSNSNKLPDVIYQVHVANVGLMQIQLVEVLEDACTDELQRYLDRGWKLLAVCPPNDARRPSYIVGHQELEGHR